MNQRGKYIVIEGIDGSGKTSVFKNVLDSSIGKDFIAVHEPGGTPIADKIAELLKDPELKRSMYANLMLFAAARADLIDEVVRPAIESGKHVLSDRNWLSSIAYQTAEGINPEDVIVVNKIALNEFFQPDLVILLDVDVKTGMDRLKTRGQPPEYFEQKPAEYFETVRETYIKAGGFSKNKVVVNASQDLDKVTQDVQKAIKSVL